MSNRIEGLEALEVTESRKVPKRDWSKISSLFQGQRTHKPILTDLDFQKSSAKRHGPLLFEIRHGPADIDYYSKTPILTTAL